jgi:hypothetical protein
VSAVAGETVAATPRPTVDRVSRTEVVLRLAEERYTIVREGVERADETGADSADRGDGGPASTPNDASRGRSSPDRERTDEARLRRSGAARAVQRELSGDGDGQAGGEDR